MLPESTWAMKMLWIVIGVNPLIFLKLFLILAICNLKEV